MNAPASEECSWAVVTKDATRFTRICVGCLRESMESDCALMRSSVAQGNNRRWRACE